MATLEGTPSKSVVCAVAVPDSFVPNCTVTENQPWEFTVAVTPFKEGNPPNVTIKPATLWSSVTWPEKIHKFPDTWLAVKLEITGAGAGAGRGTVPPARAWPMPICAVVVTAIKN